jgi:hypothetical protein
MVERGPPGREDRKRRIGGGHMEGLPDGIFKSLSET